jgi:hypothetical protein
MMKALKQACLLGLALSLAVIWTDCSFLANAIFHKHVVSCSDCSGFSDPIEYSHFVCYADDFFMNDSKGKSNKSPVGNDLVPVLNFHLENSFITDIWQPPKFS